MEDQLVGKGAEPESGPGQKNPATLFSVGAKTRPMIRSVNK